MIELHFQGLPKTPNQLRTLHWATRARENKAWRTISAIRGAQIKPPSPYTKAKLKIIRGAHRITDYDNGIAAAKPLIDGLKDAGIISDDNSNVIKCIEFEWRYAAPKQGYVKVIVEPIE